MSQTVIAVEGVGKRYTLRHQSAPRSLRERLTHTLYAPTRWLKKNPQSDPATEDFWALRDVSFEVSQGEVLGIIGRNGAGKSTLLKILSRITEATTGRVRMRGRVASLLEVGTGFHHELSGRENIFLNGAILGMSRTEIRRKFDEIVAFAEVDKFLDTPVKHYSSGMYVRLAFAVAAHLEPEILIVDEVLAVGDAAFQKKCLGKMRSVASNEGRTVLFVSHNMPAVQKLCTRGVLMSKGQLAAVGNIDETITRYLNDVPNASLTTPWHYRQSNDALRITRIVLRSGDMPVEAVIAGQPCSFEIHYECADPARFARGIGLSILLKCDERKIVNFWSQYAAELTIAPAARGRIVCRIPAWPFREATFSVDLYTHLEEAPLEWIEGCLKFDSHDGDYYRVGRITNAGESTLFLPHQWEAHPE